VENGLSPCFIIFDSTTEPAELTSAVLPPSEAALEWERTICGLFERRARMEDEVWRLWEEGTEELARFEEFVRSRIRPECVVVPVWVDRVWRMTLELHMLSGPTGGVIGADRAWNAIRLSAWYLGRQRSRCALKNRIWTIIISIESPFVLSNIILEWRR